MAKKIGIIGGGIVGLSSAYYLVQKGHRVSILDSGNFTAGCSFHNMGMIVPSHFIPLASPGMISKGIRWMFDSTSPFYIRPRFDLDLIKWGYQFYLSSSAIQTRKAIHALRDLSLLSRALYSDLAKELPFDFGFRDRGLMMLYRSREAEHEEIETARMANELGIEARVLSHEQVQQMEPNVRVSVKGGVYYPGDAHLMPHQLVTGLINYLKEKGVEFISEYSVTGFNTSGDKISGVYSGSMYSEFDEVIISAGSWSGHIAKLLNLRIPLQPGKGYSFTSQGMSNTVQVPSIFVEARVAVTPMADTVRFGGTMELSGFDSKINMKRISGIVNSIPTYYPDLTIEPPSVSDIWYGYRPCSPDGLPYIGRPSKISNLTIATGHAMMGLSLGPATGKLVCEIVEGISPTIGLKPFDPERLR
ncbi:MAG: FAD-dependent oxidoreductase [Flammeovirgaceae bacterium]|nr:FAD-dependent oxidoreductase [Flammeovirgaceae bacterium]